MGSKKKVHDSDSSDSSDSSDDSNSSHERPQKQKKTKSNQRSRSSSESDRENASKARKRNSSKSEEESAKSENKKFRQNVSNDDRDRRARRSSPSAENTRDRRNRDNNRRQNERRFDERRHRDDYSADNFRGGRRSDNRGNRDRRDERDNRDYRNRRDDNRNRNFGGRNDRRRRSRSASFDHSSAKWGKSNETDHKSEKKEPAEKQKPNFALSGKLTEETNTYKGVVIKYSEPPEARKPKRRWRLYPFKGEKALQTLYIHRESAYLIGRDRKVVDLPIDHPSCSKQHAALQYRLVPFTRDDGTVGKRVRPYLIDLNSANGTLINNKKIEPSKYVELLERDVIKFGFSSREYVLLHENSKDEAQDDDVKQEEEEQQEVKVKIEQQ